MNGRGLWKKTNQEIHMRFVPFLVSPLVTVALIAAFGWPVLLACFAIALGTLVFSTGDTEAEKSSTTLEQSA
jgi:divalent metal cation (Fe/Co/Zn/Cd) transporter